MYKFSRKCRYLTMLAPTIASLIPATVLAQATAAGADAADIGEITVTARKREETLTDVPLSIQAFSSEEIAKSGVRDLQDLSKYTPSLFFVNGTQGAGGRSVSEVRFRGLSTAGATPTNQAGSVFMDGIFVLGGAQSIGFEDIERVEVIKGPQSAYFGRATFAGVVNYITKDPTDTLTGEVNVSYSPSFGSYKLSGALSGPLIPDILSARLSGSARHKGAQYTATDGGKLGEEHTDSVNLSLLFTPAPGLRVKLRGSYSEDNDGPPTSAYYAYTGFANCPVGTPFTVMTQNGAVNTTLAAQWQCGAIPYNRSLIDSNTGFVVLPAEGPYVRVDLRDVFVNNSAKDPLLGAAPYLDHFGLTRQMWRVAGNIEYEISDDLDLTIAGGWNKQDLNAIKDGDGTVRPQFYIAAPFKFEDKSAEARLSFDNGGWLRASVGANYYTQKIQADFDNGVTVVNKGITTAGPVRAVVTSSNNENDKVETKGFFFGVDAKPLEWLTITGEGRYQIDTYSTFAGNNAAGNLAPQALESKNFTPRVILSINPVPDMTLYASYSVGTLPGGFNSNYIALSDANKAIVRGIFPAIQESIEAEKLKNYEIGYKQHFRDLRLTVSLSAFRMDWENLKTSSSIVVPSFTNQLFSIRIPGTARIKGFEFEGSWAATRNLSFRSSAGYLDAKYVDYANVTYNSVFVIPSSNPYKADGNALPRTPDWTASGSATWEAPLHGDWNYRIRADVLYTGRQFLDETNLSTIAAFTTANLTIGVETDKMSVELYATNLFNKQAWGSGRRNIDVSQVGASISNAFQGAYATPIDLREVGIKMGYRF